MPTGLDFLGDYGPPSEAVQLAIPMAVVVNDTDTATEAVSLVLSAGVAVVVFDDDVATEVVAVQIPMQVVVAETDAASESVGLVVNPLFVAVSDDTPGAEVVTVQLPLAVVVADDTPATEFINATPSLGVSVFDDNTFPPLEPPPMPATGIARDYVDVEEGLEMGLGIPVAVGDDVTVGEIVAIALPLPVLAVDQLSPLDVVDATFVTIQPLFAEAVDVVGPTDVVIMAPTVTVAVGDAVGPTEAVQVTLPLEVEASEVGTPTEAVDVRTGALLVSVADDDAPADVVAGEPSVLLLGVMDLLTLEDVAGSLIPMAIRVVDEPVGAEDFAIGERRRVTTGYDDDLHLINDGSREAVLTGGAVTRRI